MQLHGFEIPAEDDQEITEMLCGIYDEQDDYRDRFGTWPTPVMFGEVR